VQLPATRLKLRTLTWLDEIPCHQAEAAHPGRAKLPATRLKLRILAG